MNTVQQYDADAFKAAAGEAVTALYVAHGYANLDGGIPERDNDLLAEAVYGHVRTAVAESKKARKDAALKKGTLASLVFPKAPGAEPGTVSDLDEMAQEVWRQIVTLVWAMVEPSGGKVQRMLGERKTGLVLIREPKFVKENDAVPVVYVTADEDLILQYGLKPAAEKVRDLAKRYGKMANAVVDRVPETEDAVLRATRATNRDVKKIIAEQLALTSGSTTPDEETTDTTTGAAEVAA